MAADRLAGRLATGVGMGKTFTRLGWARKQFMDKLGIDPHPGTVNVVVDDPDSLRSWARLKRTDGIRVENPNDGPHDCDAKCWPVLLDGGVEGAIVYPLVPGYPPAQVEVIAAVDVRAALGIEDGDAVVLDVRR